MTFMREGSWIRSRCLVLATILAINIPVFGQETVPDDGVVKDDQNPQDSLGTQQEAPQQDAAATNTEAEKTEPEPPVVKEAAADGPVPQNASDPQRETVALEEKKDKPSWLDMFTLKADLRYRFEIIDDHKADLRYRHRIRARVGLQAEIYEDLDAFVGLGTGGSNDPKSNNQSLDDAFSSKPIWLDLAYFDYHPSYAKGLSLIGGKMKNPFYRVGKSELQWDPDLNPEGLSLNFQRTFGIVEPFVHTGAFFVEERKADDDTWLLGVQAGLRLTFADGLFYVLAGAGYMDYTHLQGKALLWDDEDSFGNSTVTVQDDEGNDVLLYAEDYNEVNGFAELGGKIARFPWAVFADFGVNTATDKDNLGWLVGASFGKCKKSLDFALRYIYREVEKDAVYGLHTDSDFAGGKTDATGHEVNFSFQIVKHVQFAASYFYNEKTIAAQDPYHRAQIDFKFKF